MSTHILDTIDMQRLGKELQHARKRKGMTQEEAARVIDAKRTTMIAIEQGKRRVKASELIKLAHAYGQQVHDLVRQRPDVDAFGLQFRGPFLQTDNDQDELMPARMEFEDLCRNYLELETITSQPLPRKYPSEYPYAGMPLEATAESIAANERNRLGLGDGPVANLRSTLENDVGLRIFFIRMPPQFSELYAYDEALGGCMAINIIHFAGRQLLSMAHGYFHFLASRQQSEVYIDKQYQRQPELERFANSFANYFLMPTAGLTRRFNELQRIGSITPTTLSTLASSYGVSPQALTLRLESMRLLPSGTWERIKNVRLVKLQEEHEESELTSPPAYNQKYPVRYCNLVFEAFIEEHITEGQFAGFLDVNRMEARQLIMKLGLDQLSEEDSPHDTTSGN